MLPPSFDARLVSARALSPSVRELVFERADGAPFVFDAGQWVSLVLPLDGGEVRRAYSIASAPDGGSRFELAVTHVAGGVGSSYLHGLQPGAQLKAIGPQGFFTRPLATAAPSLFIATGTGVTPLRSMILSALSARHPAPIVLLFGVRHEEDILYAAEFSALAEQVAGFELIVTLSRPGETWSGRRGYVQTHVEGLWQRMVAASATAPHAYACGLQRMLVEVRERLRKDLGVPRQQVHTERYD